MGLSFSGGNSKFARALQGKCSRSLCEKIIFTKAEIENSGASWLLYFDCLGMPEPEEMQELHHALRSIIPPAATFSVNFHYVQFDEKDIQKIVMAQLQQQKPSYAAGMTDARWALEGDTVTIIADPRRASLSLLQNGLQSTVKGIIKEQLGQELKVCLSLEEDDRDCLLEDHIQRVKELEQEISAQMPPPREKTEKKPQAQDERVILGKAFRTNGVTPLKEISELSGRVIVHGEILDAEIRPLKSGTKSIFTFKITDYTSSISAKMFLKNEKVKEIEELLQKGRNIYVRGDCVWDKFVRELVLMAGDIMQGQEKEEKNDDAPIKRVELHLHTRMSQMDSVVDPGKLTKMLKRYGHDAVAITDHGVVQAFPDMESALAKNKVNAKIIFGVEAYLLDDCQPMLNVAEDSKLDALSYVVFDIESTGLSPLTNKIIEIGAVKIQNGEVVDRFSQLIDPKENLTDEIINLTHINDAMLRGQPVIEEVLPLFLAFAKDCVLVAHNADFDVSFIRAAAQKQGLSFDRVYADTLRLSRELLTELKTHRLNKVCDYLGIRLEGHHRAVNDAEATAFVFLKLIKLLQERNINTAGELNAAFGQNSGGTYHAVLLAKDKTGLFNLYKLVTDSHLHHLAKQRPRIPKSLLSKNRQGLIVTSACESGEVFSALMEGASPEKLEKTARFYDCLEVQPIGNNAFLLREGRVKSEEQLKDLNMRIIALGDRCGIPVIATGDVHFLEPQDEFFRRLIQNSQGYKDADFQAPLYYRTTEEMLAEFAYVPEEKRKEIVIDNPRKIAELCQPMESFPRDKLYTPKMEGAEEQIREMAYGNAKKMYGDPLPELVQKRLDKEVNAIIKHGFAVLYLIAHKVVGKSLSDGYLVGSRGSVGSSFAATMTNITEVNPLPPHYLCNNCKYSDFEIDTEQYDCGIDMPEKNCPRCGAPLSRLGFNIPFEVFMGFDGDKAPDIDLNFSGDYQPVIHKYIEELFGKDYVFRAGTIGGVAEKTAIGYALKYFEERGKTVNSAELSRVAAGCIDVKRTTGQHPGGMVVLPKEHDIHEFTPLQYPANDPSKGIITTHFDFNSLHDTMLKLDILGHDDPTAIRMLEDLTGINARQLPLTDPKVMSLFLSTEALGVTPEQIGSEVGTYGIPEFGTNFVRKMLLETKPTTFSNLVKISGLSHGTDVWSNNAQELIQNNITDLAGTICTREDIMNTLLQKGVPAKLAFKTMESVRKGKRVPDEARTAMEEAGIPKWFIESCDKIKYMFPKAHAAAYVTMAIRIAYFKVYYPLQYYITYFTVRADDFEIGLMQGGVESIRARIKEYYEKSNLNAREKGILVMLEIALEMKMRGFDFADIDIYKSDATKFLLTDDGKILPPLTAVPGLGETAALSIAAARTEEPFRSQEDLLARTKLSSTLLESLLNIGCLRNLPASIQMNIFELA